MLSPAAVTVAVVWHPWRSLGRSPELEVRWTEDLPFGVLGATDGARIWLDSRQLQVERRCTLAHELEHVARGHTSCVGERAEQEVRQAAARRLVTLEAMLNVATWTDSLEEAADELWVDLDTLYARLDGMTVDEKDQLVERYRALEGGC